MTKSTPKGTTSKGPATEVPTTGKAKSWLLPWEIVSPPMDTSAVTASDEDLNVRYVKGEIRIVTEQARYSIGTVRQMLATEVEGGDGAGEKQYQLDPEYQRRHRWSKRQKSRLIESFLMNIPVPPVFIYERDFNKYEVMDGRQRLTAINDFYAGAFALTELEYWKELDGRKYSELPSKIRDGIDRRYLSAIVLLKESGGSDADSGVREARLKKLVFARLNSGGVDLEGQELRNAIYGGPLNKLCLELSRYQPFRDMWGFPSMDVLDADDTSSDDEDDGENSHPVSRRAIERVRRMEDVELVLEFFAYRHINKFPGALNKKKEFLDWFIGAFRFSGPQLEEYAALFRDTIDLLSSILGETAFHSWRQQPMKVVYDPMMFVASRYHSPVDRDLLVQGKNVVSAKVKAMFDANKEIFGGRKTNDSYIAKRNDAVANVFAAVLSELRR